MTTGSYMAGTIPKHNLLTPDCRWASVRYEGKTVPGGTIGCEALNISDVLWETWHRQAGLFGKSFGRLVRTG